MKITNIGLALILFGQSVLIGHLYYRERVLTQYCKSSAKMIHGLYYAVTHNTIEETLSKPK